MVKHHDRQKQPLDAVAVDRRQQCRRIPSHLFRDEHERAPGKPGREDLLERNIEARARELEGAVPRTHARGCSLPRQQIDERAVRHRHPFGLARRTRRVEHVGEVLDRRGPPRQHGIRELRHSSIIVEKEHDRTASLAWRRRCGTCFRNRMAEAWQRRLRGNHHRAAGIRKQECQPRGGEHRIHRHVAAAGLEDAQQPHEQIGRPLHEKPHRHIGPHTEFPQSAGEPVGMRLQLSIGPGPAVPGQRHSNRRAVGLPVELLVNTFIRSSWPGRTILFERHEPPFGRRQQGDRVERR